MKTLSRIEKIRPAGCLIKMMVTGKKLTSFNLENMRFTFKQDNLDLLANRYL